MRQNTFLQDSGQIPIERLGFVQADPIRAPARAQDLTLRHRVRDYRAGDLEERYGSLPIEEDFFINYGFLPRQHHALMHPRPTRGIWSARDRRRAADLLSFVQEHGAVHPRQVEAHFAHGRVTNYWGGVSSATTHLLDAMHYRGLLRVARRDNGVRLYAVAIRTDEAATDASARRTAVDALVDLVVHAYAPVPQASLRALISRLRFAVPQWAGELSAAAARAKTHLQSRHVAGTDWYWPSTERQPVAAPEPPDDLRLLAPFDPLVWDRRRFELLWGWAYRFEAYTPAAKRKLGYYALPLLFRDHVVGWANVTVKAGRLDCGLGFVGARPTDPAFDRALEAELARMQAFLGHESSVSDQAPARRTRGRGTSRVRKEAV